MNISIRYEFTKLSFTIFLNCLIFRLLFFQIHYKNIYLQVAFILNVPHAIFLNMKNNIHIFLQLRSLYRTRTLNKYQII